MRWGSLHRSGHGDAASAAGTIATASVSRHCIQRADQSHGVSERGAVAVAARLARRRFAGVRGEHRQERCDSTRAAVDDYLECFRIVAPHADYVAINVSSPNTEGSATAGGGRPAAADRECAGRSAPTLQGATARRVPLLVKVSPDLASGRPGAQRAAGVPDRHRRNHRHEHDFEPQRDLATLALACRRVERRSVASACPAGGAVAADGARCRCRLSRQVESIRPATLRMRSTPVPTSCRSTPV